MSLETEKEDLATEKEDTKVFWYDPLSQSQSSSLRIWHQIMEQQEVLNWCWQNRIWSILSSPGHIFLTLSSGPSVPHLDGKRLRWWWWWWWL